MLVEMVSPGVRDALLSKVSNLRTVPKFRSVYISRDQTKSEKAPYNALKVIRDSRNAALEFSDSEGRKYGERDDVSMYFWSVRFGRVIEVNRRKEYNFEFKFNFEQC